MSYTRLGPHLIDPSDTAMAWLRTANIVKVLDRPLLLRECRPGAVTIYRKYFAQQPLERHGSDVAAEVIDDCRRAGVVPTFIELYNECGQFEGDRLLQLASEAWPVAHGYGTEVLALSGGTGWWESSDWLRWEAAGYYGVRAIALHAYWNGPLDGWNSLRHRTVHQWTNGNHPAFCVTECGRDSLRAGEPGGWQAQGITTDQYRAELEQYDRELQVDPYIIGGVVFTANGTATWAPFSTDPLGVPETVPAQLWPT